jgi:DNA-binding CsgD family transcriptional regulator/large-conductance mechanosensitive channel
MRFLKKIINLGTEGLHEDSRKTMVQLLNCISLVLLAICLFSLYHFHNDFQSNPSLFFFILANAILLFLVLLYNGKKKHETSKHLFMVLLMEGTLWSNLFFGSIAIYNFVTVIVPPVLFKSKKTIALYFTGFAILYGATIGLQLSTAPWHQLTPLQLKASMYIYAFIDFFICAFVLVYVHSQLTNRFEQRLNQHNKALKEEKDRKSRELTGKSIQLANTADFLDAIHARIHQVLENETLTKADLRDISKEINLFEKEGIWNEFQVYFSEVHPDFFRKMKEQCPMLTQGELRVCALLVLNLNTKEIARITQKSFKSIEVTRTRIRKKLNLARHESLYHRVAGFSPNDESNGHVALKTIP